MRTTLHSDHIHAAISRALQGRQLLTHAFYQRWEAGTLTDGELAAYAEQYRHIEQALPQVLAEVAAALPDGPARRLVEANLADERSNPAPHVELFESFADAVGARRHADATPATAVLIDLEMRAAATDPVVALSMLAAYELQAAEIASSKSAGLAEHFSIDADGTRFWDVHAGLERDHASWSVDALALLTDDVALVERSATFGAQAWWEFLDDREASAPALV